MATLTVDGSDLVVRLSALEKIGAMRGDIRAPLASVRAVRQQHALVGTARHPGAWQPARQGSFTVHPTRVWYP
jgi:hypothetical protein